MVLEADATLEYVSGENDTNASSRRIIHARTFAIWIGGPKFRNWR